MRAQSAKLPAAVDNRPDFERFGLTPRRQGGRPTCSVFAVAGALEFAVARRQGHGVRLSIEFLNWAAGRARGHARDGGFFSELWDGFAEWGLCLEDDMPYRDAFDPALPPPAAAYSDAKTRLGLGLRLQWIKEWDVETGLKASHLTGIRRALAAGWPVCAGLRWPKQETWTDGVLDMRPPEGVRDGHSILFVGYRQDPGQPGGGVFIFRNSGGDGRDGLMTYEYAKAYTNDAALIDWPARPKPVAGRKTARAGQPALFRDPLGGLAAPPMGRSRRVSSNEQPRWNDANLDMTPLPPGKSVEMPLLEGPGVITHMWLTSHAGGVGELNSLTLRIYWDGREEPGVEVPLGEFFAVGQGRPAVVESVPVQVSPSGSLSCYWRMPFAESARIVVTNDNPHRLAGLYWQVDWMELDALPLDTGYFHARYRQEYPAVSGRDYLIADIEGQGQYVGTVMSVTMAQDGWWGEGDDFFTIDGEKIPSLQGTGSEDYFNDAWGFRPRTGHWFGQPRWQGYAAGDSGVCYRWHVQDPVCFASSLRLTMEHKGNRPDSADAFFIERPDFINSVAFWYQTGLPKPGPALPPYPERNVPWQSCHAVRAFRSVEATGSGKLLIDATGMFGARPVLHWANTETEGRLTLPVDVAAAGRYALRLTAGSGPGFGVYEISLDGDPLDSAASFAAADGEELDLSLGVRELTAGVHRLTFRALPVGGGGAGPLTIEALRLLALPPEATRPVKTHNEAHFVRLAIGRGVYAHRLAFGSVPDSLQALVDADLLSARYLKDENGRALTCRREGAALVVESTGAEPWTYRWEGLDARR